MGRRAVIGAPNRRLRRFGRSSAFHFSTSECGFRPIGRGPPKMKGLAFSILCFASAVVFADDFKTVDGKEYKNATVSRVEPDGIVLTSKSGISKIYFTELPKEVQERFHYDAAKATAYSAEQNAALEQLRKQREEAQREKAEETAKNNKYFTEQQSATESAKNQTESPNPPVERLQSNYQAMAETFRKQLSAVLDDEKVEAYLLGELRRVSQKAKQSDATPASTTSSFDAAFHREKKPNTVEPTKVEITEISNFPSTLKTNPSDLYFRYHSTMAIKLEVKRHGRFESSLAVGASEKGVWQQPDIKKLLEQVKAKCDANADELERAVNQTNAMRSGLYGR